jgi:hypothetical protein
MRACPSQTFISLNVKALQSQLGDTTKALDAANAKADAESKPRALDPNAAAAARGIVNTMILQNLQLNGPNP